MPSTEFLLYLVTVILVVFLIMNYYQNETSEPEVQYRYIPVYTSDDEEGKGSRRSRHYDNRSEGPMGGHGMGPGMGPGPYPGPGGPPPGPGTPPPGPGDPPPPIDPLRKFDYDAVHDEFTPPFRRSYYDDYNYRLPPALYPTYTRGPPGRFRKIGNLVAQGVNHNDKFKFLYMMGREKYPGREFEYYAVSPNRDCQMKFYFKTNGKEINDGDIVTHEDLEGYTYQFSEDEDLSPKYDPYFI